ncbi:MAG: sigma-70 family RNA polymerase sigma factor [Clostridia bacterium]|nr:sigma-70 family RNA polymerase sigma factor [Clostridia bacterium]MBQ3651521.1 sigma-70 family RNA polymerase sigma factor [Clostridia bacterium]
MPADAFTDSIRRLQAGDQAAEERLMEENMPLVAAIARRYRNCGLVQEDMLQLGSIGLLQALRRFDPDRGLCFSTYAVPLIAGEIRRFLRDDGMVKFSRETKSLAIQIERIRREQGDLTLEELSARLQVPAEDIAAALASRTAALSLDAPADEDGADLQTFLGSANTDTEKDALRRVELRELFSVLSERERQVLFLRYFQDRTQNEVGKQLGLSQVQISRIEKKALLRMRQQGNKA